MIVTSARHTPNFMDQPTNTVVATIDGVEMQIPMDPANRHYAAILEWVADGNTIQEAD
jgi:hypothetical protein|tara:strand:+ start:333 stop:506 length:174 start_codon:yes stop_codon:yes gene_type:complete